MGRSIDDVATGVGQRRIPIRGRPREGTEEKYTLLEEPGECVLMHWHPPEGRVPHFKRGTCPYCDPEKCSEDQVLTPLWYVGAADGCNELVIVELTLNCFRTAEVAARRMRAESVPLVPLAAARDALLRCLNGEITTVFQTAEEVTEFPVSAVFAGLVVKIGRRNFAKSPRVLRCNERIRLAADAWPYQTRHELARIWGITPKLKIHREQA